MTLIVSFELLWKIFIVLTKDLEIRTKMYLKFTYWKTQLYISRTDMSKQ